MEWFNRFRQAVFLASLPYRKSFYSRGGWSASGGPGANDWPLFLSAHFSSDQIARARMLARDATLPDAKNNGVILYWDSSYPGILKQIYDPPVALFWSGDEPLFSRNFISIVGTRDPARISCIATKGLVGSLPGGSGVVSGFARGIDREAHKAGIERGLCGIAVLASGTDRPSPLQNLDLVRIAKKREAPFTFLSEFPFGTLALQRNFVRRNRIIAGLSRSLFVMQAPQKSGALITASFAMDEGRDVLVFDHPLLERPGLNEGGRALLFDGAIADLPWKPTLIKEPLEKEALQKFWLERIQGRLVDVGGGFYAPNGADSHPSIFPDFEE